VLGFVVVASLTAVLFQGCGRRHGDDQRSPVAQNHDRSRPTDWSRTNLTALLPAGAPTNTVVTNLGMPDAVIDLGNQKVAWFYEIRPPLAGENGLPESARVAVQVSILNGRCGGWDYVLGQSLKPRPRVVSIPLDGRGVADTAQATTTRPILRLFVVSSNPVMGGQFVDTSRFPKLGYIHRVPDGVFESLKEVTLNQVEASSPTGANPTGWDVFITLVGDDAKRLAEVTESSVGKRVLIEVGGEYIAAPFVKGPIDGGSLAFRCKEAGLIDKLKSDLASLKSSGLQSGAKSPIKR